MTTATRYRMLFQPFRLGPLSLRNRVVLPPMQTNFATADGHVTQRLKDYYAERAKGVGLVIVEDTSVNAKQGKSGFGQLVADDDKFIPGLSELAASIKRQGASAAIQIQHGGSQALRAITGNEPVSSSPVKCSDGSTAHELTKGEILETVAHFAQTALRARKAGFEGVELHGASSYLIAQFLSRAYNQRKDEYGGEAENRARFLVEIIQAIRKVAGSDFPVWCRLNGQEFGLEGGVTLEEAQFFARKAESAGACAIHVTGFGGVPGWLPFMAHPEGRFLSLARGVKSQVKVPIIVTGRLSPKLGDGALVEGTADLIAMGRALIADPEIPQKAASSREDEIRACIFCGRCMGSLWEGDRTLRCVVNPAVGREMESEIKLAAKKKRVVVIGGGPAGMEAARDLAMRGHSVILFEKQGKLGGQMDLAIIPPHKQSIKPFTQYLASQVEKTGVQVKLGKEATLESIAEVKPEAVVLATGSTPIFPEIPGCQRKSVVQAVDVLEGKVEVGNRVVIIGGELVGCETAEFLADKGKKVVVARRGPEMATKVWRVARPLLLRRLEAKGIETLPGVKYEEITEVGLVVATREGQRRVIEADTIVVAAGSKPNDEMRVGLQRQGVKVYPVGDCVAPRDIEMAVTEGSRVAREI